MVLKHHEAGLGVGGAGAGGGSAASCPTPGTPWVQPAQPTHTGRRRETVSRTQPRGKEFRSEKKKVEVERKQEARKITEGREGEDAVGGGRGGEEDKEGRQGEGECIPTEEEEDEEGREVGSKRAVTQLESV